LGGAQALKTQGADLATTWLNEKAEPFVLGEPHQAWKLTGTRWAIMIHFQRLHWRDAIASIKKG